MTGVRRGASSWAIGVFVASFVLVALPSLLTLLGLLPISTSAWLVLSDAHVWTVNFQTVLVSLTIGVVSSLLAIPAASMLIGGGPWARGLVLVLAVTAFAIAEPAWSYAWSELLRVTVGMPSKGDPGDWIRVIVTASTQHWLLPALLLWGTFRSMPAGALDAAELDGGKRTIAFSLTWPAGLFGVMLVALIASRLMHIFGQTGLVMTTALAREVTTMGPGAVVPISPEVESAMTPADRYAAAEVVALPTVVPIIVGLLVSLYLWAKRRDATEIDAAQPGRVPLWSKMGVIGLALLLIIPLATLWHVSIGTAIGAFVEGVRDNFPQMLVSFEIAGIATLLAAVLLLDYCLGRANIESATSIILFLIGGQLVSLGFIRVWTLLSTQGVFDPIDDALYGEPLYYAWPQIMLTGWIAVALAGVVRSGRIARLSEMARLDGAGPWRVLWHVTLPLCWPQLLGGLIVVFLLAQSESAATTIMVPGNLVNTMMTNMHTLAYAPMASAALVSALVCGGLALLAVLLLMPRSRKVLPLLLLSTFFVGCGGSDKPDEIWSSSGRGQGQVVYPRGITYSPAEDCFWVVDRAARVQKLDKEGNFLLGFDMPQNEFGKPVGISVDPDGNLWVPDTHYNRVIVYKPDGTEWFRYGTLGHDPGEFVWPTDIQVAERDGETVVYIAEYGQDEDVQGDRIQMFRLDGTELTMLKQIGEWGLEEGQFRRPQSMVLDGDDLWVTDAANHRLLCYDAITGEYKKTLGDGGASDAPGRFRFPYGLDLTNDGDLVVTEFGNNRVQIIDPETGASKKLWGSAGVAEGKLRYPWAAAYDPERDRIIIADSGNDRLQIISPD